MAEAESGRETERQGGGRLPSGWASFVPIPGRQSQNQKQSTMITQKWAGNLTLFAASAQKSIAVPALHALGRRLLSLPIDCILRFCICILEFVNSLEKAVKRVLWPYCCSLLLPRWVVQHKEVEGPEGVLPRIRSCLRDILAFEKESGCVIPGQWYNFYLLTCRCH